MSLDRSVNPCDDFYGFSCGKWENTHTIQMLLHTQENGGSEYDNFVKMRIKVMENLNNVKYSKTHEWVRIEEDGTALIRISDYLNFP